MARFFEISLEREITAHPEFVFDWWTDLSPDDSKLVKPLKSRKIINRTPSTIKLHDEEEMYFKKMSFDVTVTLERPTRWVSEYDGNIASAKSEYLLVPESDTQDSKPVTKLHYHTRIEPKGVITGLFSPIVKQFVKRVFAAEMKVFIRELEAEYERTRLEQDKTERRPKPEK
jgi:hypothetical protein